MVTGLSHLRPQPITCDDKDEELSNTFSMQSRRGVCLQLPDYCASYGNIQASGMNLPTVNPVTSNGTLYTPLAPSPPRYWPPKAGCNANPCINTCCTLGPDGFCQDNLLALGGHYAPGEAPPHKRPVRPLSVLSSDACLLGIACWIREAMGAR